MRPEEFSRLVDEHAQAWQKVGSANPSLCFDPGLQYYRQNARELSRELVDAFKDKPGDGK